MSHFLLSYNDYRCTLLIHGYQKSHSSELHTDLNTDVCSVIIEYILMPIPLYAFVLFQINELIADKLDCILIYEYQSLNQYGLSQNFITTWNDHKVENITNEPQSSYIHSSIETIKHKELLTSISRFVQFSSEYPSMMNIWNIVIEYGKKWMNAKYDINKNNKISDLIDLYERYYCSINKEDLYYAPHRNLPDMPYWKGTEDQIRMSKLLQSIMIDYKENDLLNELMTELNEIVDLIKVKYEMLSYSFEPQRKNPMSVQQYNYYIRRTFENDYDENSSTENQALENDPFEGDENWGPF